MSIEELLGQNWQISSILINGSSVSDLSNFNFSFNNDDKTFNINTQDAEVLPSQGNWSYDNDTNLLTLIGFDNRQVNLNLNQISDNEIQLTYMYDNFKRQSVTYVFVLVR
jgi:hypothetical protein